LRCNVSIVMKKYLIYWLLCVLIFLTSAKFNIIKAQGQFAPQPGISCGKGFDPATQGNFDPNDFNHRQYSCCFSPVEDFGTIDKDFIASLPVGIDWLVEKLVDFVNAKFDSIPFFFLPVSTAKLLPSVGDIKQGMKTYMDKNRCVTNASPIGKIGEDSCYCKANSSPALAALKPFCDNISSSSEKTKCYQCIGYNPSKPSELGEGGVWTGIGCIRTTTSQFVTETVMGLGISLAGIISLICIIYAAIVIQISGGNPERIKKAQEMLTSCIMGLLLIIFSIFILRVIGVDILRIPGFG